MFEFLSRMFAFVEAAPANAGDQLLDAAIETAVDGTDPRLRLLSDYRKRLRPAAEAAIAHVWGLAASLTSPAELSRAGFSADPRIHLLFCSADSLRETVSRDANVRAFLAAGNGLPEGFYALLLARKTEKRTLGMRLAGEVLQNEVPQTVLSFSEHRLVAVSPSLEETLVLIKRGAYRQLVHCALATLTAIRNHDTPLLRERLEAMSRFHGGNDHPFWPHHRCEGNGDARQRLGEIDHSLAQCDPQACSLDDYLTVVAGVLASPERALHQDVFEATVDRMGVIQPEGEAVGVDRIALSQVYLPDTTEPNVTLLVRVPMSEILPDTGLKLDAVL